MDHTPNRSHICCSEDKYIAVKSEVQQHEKIILYILFLRIISSTSKYHFEIQNTTK